MEALTFQERRQAEGADRWRGNHYRKNLATHAKHMRQNARIPVLVDHRVHGVLTAREQTGYLPFMDVKPSESSSEPGYPDRQE